MEEMQTLILKEHDSYIKLGVSSVIGKRAEQQDTVKTDDDYAYIKRGSAIAIVCDGMGGLHGGKQASQRCADILYETFQRLDKEEDIPSFFQAAIAQADSEVRNMQNAGTTLVSIVVKGDKLYWASVGDSRIYIIREGEILCVTQDHNYMLILNQKVMSGEIEAAAAEEDPQKEALISYVGMGGVRLIDSNRKEFQLLSGDYVVLCSDGLYRSLTIEEIKDTIIKNAENTQAASEELTELVESKGKKHQDNASVVVMNYKDNDDYSIPDEYADSIQKNIGGA